MATTITPAHDMTVAEVDALEDRLYEHNSAASGHADAAGLGFVARDDDGAVLGAIAGHSWGGVAEFKQLWVHEAARGQGLGLALLDAALAEATRRGCVSAFVLSYDFQAPELYEKRGFERVAVIDGWPVGHQQVILRKMLA